MNYRTRANFQPQLGRQPACYHIADAPKVVVRRVSLKELINKFLEFEREWNIPEDNTYYVECQLNGNINWKSANVYTSRQLVGRNHVYVYAAHKN